MLKLTAAIPRGKVYIACSGGVDSIVLLNFILNSNRHVEVIYFNHMTQFGIESEKFIQHICNSNSIKLHTSRLKNKKPKKQSLEEFWSIQRNKFFNSFDGPVLTAHHLNDAMEWWIFSSLHGEPKLIPIQNENVIRPFLLSSKDDIKRWAKAKELTWIDDPSNEDTSFRRNFIRHELMPKALMVNPGLEKIIRKKYLKVVSTE